MSKKISNVYQFKITLKGIKPPIWSRIQVPDNYTFCDLHVAIQGAMGWLDCHLHHFEIHNTVTIMKEEIDIPDEEYEETLTWAGGDFKPEKFDPEKVKFDDPFKRWRHAFSE